MSVDDGPHFANKAIVVLRSHRLLHCRSDLLSTLIRGIFGDHPPSSKRCTAGLWHQGHNAVADVFRQLVGVPVRHAVAQITCDQALCDVSLYYQVTRPLRAWAYDLHGSRFVGFVSHAE